jgi:hypothetical protein
MNQGDKEIWCSLLLGIERAEHFGQHAESPIRYTKSLTTGEIISSLCTSYSRRNECRRSWLVRLPRLDRNKCEILHNAPWFPWRLAKFRRKRSLWGNDAEWRLMKNLADHFGKNAIRPTMSSINLRVLTCFSGKVSIQSEWAPQCQIAFAYLVWFTASQVYLKDAEDKFSRTFTILRVLASGWIDQEVYCITFIICSWSMLVRLVPLHSFAEISW